MAINLSRNTRLFVSTVEAGWTNANTFEIPIQEGYSLSQSVASSDVTLNEAGDAPIRGTKRFNDSLDPVEWSFSTYITPYVGTAVNAGNKIFLPDMIMWQGLAVRKGGALDFETASSRVHGTVSQTNVSFADNGAHVLTELYLFFKIDNSWYKVHKAQVGQAELSVDIEALGMVAWSGQGTRLELLSAAPAFFSGTAGDYDATTTAPGYATIPSNRKYVLNKLTTVTLESDVAPGGSGALDNYKIPVTSANVTINNNITYITPATLAEVDTPVASFTGAFEVTGSLSAYLRISAGATGAVGAEYSAADLMTHMLSANNLSKVTNNTNIVISMGGTAVGDAKCVITIPTAHLSVPTMSVDEVVSTEIEFKGIPSSASLLSGTEVSLAFKHSVA
jgi:hypothetical protein